MNEEIRIPLYYREGMFRLSDLPADTGDFLTLRLEPCDVVSYNVPGKGNEVRLYDLEKQDILNYLTATYRSTGELYCVELRDGEDVMLVYLHCLNEEEAKNELLDFAEQSASEIAEELLRCKDKVLRLFIEHFYDGESFDFAAKIATEADWKKVLESAGERAAKRINDPRFVRMLMNNSGNYPHENRVPCDSHTCRIMLQCAPGDMHEMVVDEMAGRIKERVVPLLDKTEDFQFIVSEYD